jgi:hypothetical protein
MESLDHGLEPLWVKPGYACSYGVLRSWVRTRGSNQAMLAHMESLDHGLEPLCVKPGYKMGIYYFFTKHAALRRKNA